MSLTLSTEKGKFSRLFCHLLTLSKVNIFKKFYHEQYKSVKWFGSRSGPTVLSGLISLQTVSKDYQQMTLVGKRVNLLLLLLSEPVQ